MIRIFLWAFSNIYIEAKKVVFMVHTYSVLVTINFQYE